MATDPTTALAEIRVDIEETVTVYNLDGAGKNSYPVSAAMSRHARSLLAAVEAVLKIHRPVWNDYVDGDGIERSSHDCAECEPPGTPDNWPCPTYRAIEGKLEQ